MGKKLNPLKTHWITISQSRTPHPLLCGLDLSVFSFLELLRVTIDDKLTFEKYIHNIASSIAQKSGLICKCYKILDNNDAVNCSKTVISCT